MGVNLKQICKMLMPKKTHQEFVEAYKEGRL